ncbi:MAG: glycoside hydrolase family 31 protein [Myxococcales bacterium]|jgi:alpha-glucosidase
MKVTWIMGLGLVLAIAVSGCSDGEGSSGLGDAQVVATDDGTVEVVIGERVLFALAPTGPIARNFDEEPVGIGAITFERTNEVADPLLVQSVATEGAGVRVEYASASRSATLTAKPVGDEASEFRLELAGPPADSIAVGIRCDASGTFHGFGEQYNATNQRGEAFELMVNEQGNGRDGGPGISVGNEHTTYFPMPYYIDARGFGALFTTSRRVDVDLCATDQDIAWIEVISGAPVQWRVFHGPTGLDVIRQLGDLVGRPDQPPSWAYNLWMAAQGGRQAVESERDKLEAAGIPTAAFWVQDWGGIRLNFDGGSGVQYVWNADETLYPSFAGMVSEFHDAGYKFLTYVNPFIVDPSSVAAEDDPARFAERFNDMQSTGLLLRDQIGETYIEAAVPNIPQRDAHPDFSNPATFEYVVEALKEIVRVYDVDGWMADFGEWVPVDSVPADGSDPIERRNTFPVDWHHASREALESVRPDGDWVSFARSGFTGVQGFAQIHWTGDQETNWGELDGLPTVVPALLNLGLAGQPFVTHDIAGFARGDGPSTKELFQRWTELGAFTPIMRTHDGADKLNNWRWNTDQETTAHFRKFAFVHCALMNDFMTLASEAENTGAPILRHLMLVFPDDRDTWNISDQFMIGDALLVAPVVEEGAASRSVYFPEGTWYDVWTGESIEGGQRLMVDAPIGSPPVFSRGRDRDDLRNAQANLTVEDCR